jgi:hypothetical protein
MPLRVRNIAHLAGDEIAVTGQSTVDFAIVLTNLIAAEESGPRWSLRLVIGEGDSAREVLIALESFVTNGEFEKSTNEPMLFENAKQILGRINVFALFRNRFFVPDRDPASDAERQEFVLRVKRAAYREDEELNSLKSYVSNMEAVGVYQRDGPQRLPIPNDVKLAVWARDGGACVQCGSKGEIHFDHVIPVAKGGGNVVENIQILCAPCNLRKSDKIAP